MASTGSCTLQETTLEELKREVERLSRELDQAVSEKIQSAHYGLVLLEEKDGLVLKCEELEALYDNSKHELEITQEVSKSNWIIIKKCAWGPKFIESKV